MARSVSAACRGAGSRRRPAPRDLTGTPAFRSRRPTRCRLIPTTPAISYVDSPWQSYKWLTSTAVFTCDDGVGCSGAGDVVPRAYGQQPASWLRDKPPASCLLAGTVGGVSAV